MNKYDKESSVYFLSLFESESETASLKVVIQMLMLLAQDYASLSIETITKIRLLLWQKNTSEAARLLAQTKQKS